MCNDTYTSPTGKMLDEKRKKGTVKEYPSPFSQLYPISGFFWASQHPLFSHIHLPQAEVPSSLLQTPVPPCSCYSRVQKERVYPQLLSAPGLWQHFLTFRICSCVSSERPLHFFQCEGTGKARHFNPVFIYRSGTGQATAIWSFPCCFTQHWPLQWPKLLSRVRGSSNSVSAQPSAHRISCGMAQICQIVCCD